MARCKTQNADAVGAYAMEALNRVCMILRPDLQQWFARGLRGEGVPGPPQSPHHDRWALLRDMQDGDDVIVRETGPKRRWRKYRGQVARKVRDLKRGSERMVIRLPDGVETRCTMDWLEIAPQQDQD